MTTNPEFEFQFSLEHFAPADMTKAKELFKDSVFGVHIEIFNFCNRTCWFCENSRCNRKTFTYLDDTLLVKVLDELAEINYERFLTFHNFNEPLIH